MNQKHCVIVGGSHAAAQLAVSLRQGNWDGDISIISEETIPPYHRPPMSKSCLSGDKHINELLIRPPSFYEKLRIDLVLGTRVIEIDRTSKCVGLGDGYSIAYSQLALTTGATPRTLNLPGLELDGVFYLRSIANVQQIRRFVGPGKSAAIIGGGYIGLEAAASLRRLGMHITVLETMPRVLQRVTSEEISTFYTRVHSEDGIHFRTGISVTGLRGMGCVEAVELGDGGLVPADLVIVGIGVVPNTSLAEAAGLEVENGIVVDAYARTSDPEITAAGDCTNHYNPIYQRRLRLESVQNATDQAKVAANTLNGQLEPYNALPWFWSEQADIKLQIAGLSQGFDEVVLRGSSTLGRSFAAFYFANRRLIAVDAINRPKEFMLTRRALSRSQTADPHMLADESIALERAFTD